MRSAARCLRCGRKPIATWPIPASASARCWRRSTCAAEVARHLGNTPAVCRKCYVHPGVLDAWLDGTLDRRLGKPDLELAAREAAILKLLDKL